MSKKSKTTSNSTTNSTITPTNPSWVDNGLANVGQQISNIGAMDPYSLVAGANPLQNQAGTVAQSLGAYMPQAGSDAKWNLAGATDATNSIINGSAPQMQAASLLDGLQNYMSPYLGSVVDTTLANYDRSAGQNRAQQMLSIGGMDDTFGGSGAQAYLGNFDAANQLNRAQTEATLRDQGFNTGSNLSNLDAGRRQDASATNAQLQAQQNALKLQGAQQLANLGTQGMTNVALSDANARDNASTQANIGDILRQIQQQQLAAPLNLANFQAGAYGSLPLGLLHGTNETGTSSGTSTTTSSDPLGTAAKLAQAAAIAFSDERLKQNIRTAGYDAKGRRWADYEYVWEPGVTHRGVIAQEILASDPHAVSQHESGYLMVNYGELR